MSLLEPEVLASLPDLNREQIDDLNIGLIRVDEKGTIEIFNRYEAEFSRVQPEAAEGRNFFTQVAPCTNNRLFYGRFKKGVQKGELDLVIPYTYTYKMRPTHVTIHLYRHPKDQSYWIITKTK